MCHCHLGSYSITLEAGALADLGADGKLHVTVGATSGMYAFHGASFSGMAIPGVVLQQVPEPLTLALIGIALGGAGLARRSRQTKLDN